MYKDFYRPELLLTFSFLLLLVRFVLHLAFSRLRNRALEQNVTEVAI